MFDPWTLFGSLIFGTIGLGAFLYGKKAALTAPMIIGVALMAFPYFVSETWLLYLIGCALCAGLILFRE
jgi:hypothetical protein